MYFKKLEIVGFKSFMNKTKLKFEEGVTAVVGPNGCGKSNIVDAIKWVLGEQSAKSMRSSSMQDVIFNGTEKYEPLNFAEVSLTFDNADRNLSVDYDEVTISRRLFRSGESEYLLNKTTVRLADIRNILMGTGIGTSSYSVFEQGKMDMILSSKPEERRLVFEEASGITRYKTQKREALLKLEHTQENIVRINDIVAEVERQIKSIERQAKKAEKYKASFEELKGLDVKFARKKYVELGMSASTLGSDGGNLKKSMEESAEKIDLSSALLAESREEYNLLIESLQASQGELMKIDSSIDKNSHIEQVDTERITELEKHAEKMKLEIEKTSERHLAASSRIEELTGHYSGLAEKLKAKENEFFAEEKNIAELDEKIKGLKHELDLKREKTVENASVETEARNALIKVSSDMQNARAREKRLSQEFENVSKEKGTAFEEFRLLEVKTTEALKELEAKKIEFDAVTGEVSEAREKTDSLTSQKAEKEARLNWIRPRREFLERIIAEREGISESVKEVMKHVPTEDPRFSGIYGILSELIDVSEDYEESFESIFGDAKEAVVVDTARTARLVTEYLSENSLGSVNFVILEELENLSAGASPEFTGVLGDITSVLSSKEPFAKAVRSLLAGVFVAATSEEADAFLEENPNFSGRIVCRKGEVSSRGQRRTKNYSSKEVLSLFGRQEKLKKLIDEETVVLGQIEEAQKSLAALSEWMKEAVVKKGTIEEELGRMQAEFSDMSFDKKTAREKVAVLAEEITVLSSEMEEESSAIAHLEREKEDFGKKLEELEALKITLHRTIEETGEMIKDLAIKREERIFAISDVKAELSVLKKDDENLGGTIEREKESLCRMEEDVESKRVSSEESRARAEELRQEIERIKQENAGYIFSRESMREEINAKLLKKEEFLGVIHVEEAAVKQAEKELESMRNHQRDMDIRSKELEYKQSSILERMRDAYKIDITEAMSEALTEEAVDWVEVESRIEELKSQIERLGPVSLGAMEEHKQLEERFAFLVKQRDDLVSSKESLTQAIKKINKTTQAMFMETFEKIKVEFNDYFRMLFNGGKAELILQDESDVLECGIDITVRPPGKKVHNIMQLSGGEKAMTAVALIFAIFKVNPSPFCILDEIDAPLDESNVVRFCRVLQEFLKLSQFIIVTHNRMTIQLADILYGITMEEKGVSKVVSVKFAEDKPATEKAAEPEAETEEDAVGAAA